MKHKWKILAGILGVLVILVTGGLIAVTQLKEDFFVKRFEVGNLSFDELNSFNEAVQKVGSVESDFLNQEITWTTSQGDLNMSLGDFELSTNKLEIQEELSRFMEDAGLFKKLKVLIFGEHLDYELVYDPESLKMSFDKAESESKIKLQNPVQNAYYTYVDGVIGITPEAAGNEVTGTNISKAINGFWEAGVVPETTELKLENIEPEVTEAYLKEMQPKAEVVITKTIILVGSFSVEWSLNMGEYMSLVYPTADGTFKVHPDLFLDFVRNEISPVVEEEAQDVVISEAVNDAGKTYYTFDGSGRKEKKVDEGALIEEFEAILNGPQAPEGQELLVFIPFKTKQPNVTVPDSLAELGVTEVVGYGYSNYYDSSSNRIYNVTYGMSLMDNALIPPGEEFNYWSYIGDVDAAHGWMPEYVIKGVLFELDYGGGLCQTSTTAFRGALFSGLPIVERVNHANIISYYEPPYGQGLDATVFSPSPNFRFLNDTENHILIQSYVEPETLTAYFVIYGTDPDRDVYLRGPYDYGYYYAGDYEVQDNSLEPGTKFLYQYGIPGASVDWYRTVIDPDGTFHSYQNENGEKVVLENELIHSSYQAKPNVYKVGPAAAPAAEPSTEAPAPETP